MANETRAAPRAEPPRALSERFRAAIADDLNVPDGLAVLWEALREANRTAEIATKRALLDLVLDFDRVLGLRLADSGVPGAETLPDDVAALIQQREAARAARDWPTADRLRQAIRQRGYEVEDTPAGPRWRRTAAAGQS